MTAPCVVVRGEIVFICTATDRTARISPSKEVSRIAQSPDSNGFAGELDQPGEPCIWNGLLVVSCFDLVTDDYNINTAHELPATMSCFRLEEEVSR